MKDNCFFFLIVSIVVMCSCSENKETDYIKYEDIGVHSNKNVDLIPNESTLLKTNMDSFNFEHLDIQIQKVEEVLSSDFLDRFENQSSSKRLLIGASDSVYLKSWSYKDSLMTLNAFYNLLDCFGPNCRIVELYSDAYSEAKYNLFFISDKNIHWIHSQTNQPLLNWEKYVRKETKASAYHYIIEQKKNSGITWLEQRVRRPNTFSIIKE